MRIHWISVWSAVGLAGVLTVPTETSQAQAPAASSPAAREVPEALEFANRLYRDRRYDLAADEFQNFLRTNPNGPDALDAHFGLASARLALGRYKEARTEFETFVKDAPANHPNHATARFRVGETAYLLGDLAAARTALEGFLTESPKHRNAETAWSHLADVSYRLNDYARAKTAYEKVIAFPNGRLAERSKLFLGHTLVNLKDPDGAIKVLNDLAKTGTPEWTERASFEIARVEAQENRLEPAAKAFAAFETKFPRSALIGEAQLQRAEVLGKLDRRDEGESLLKPLTKSSSPALAARAADALGASLLARGKAADALATLDDAATKFATTPSGSLLLFHAAEAAQAAGKLDEARVRFQKASEKDASDTLADDALLRLAGMALEANDLTRAGSLADSFATKFPRSDLIADAMLIQGRVALAKPAPKEAIRILTEVIETGHPSPATAQATHYYLALAYRADGQSAKANEILDSLAKTPAATAATDAQFMLGQGHVEAGRFAEAIPALEKYLSSKPNGEVADFALAHIAQAQIETGQADAARATMEQLATRFPKSKALPITRLRLAESAQAAKQYDRAAELFRLAAEGADPAVKARARWGNGWALLSAGKATDAAEAFEKFAKESSDDPLAPDAAFAKGRALEAAKQSEAGLSAYVAVVSRYPKAEAAGKAALARARLLVELKRGSEAAEAYTTIERDYPKADAPEVILAEHAWALVDAEKTADADALFNRVLKEFPNSAKALDARFNLAESAFTAKKFDEVAPLLQPLLAADSKAKPELVQSALYRLGRTQVELKQPKEAQATFERLIKDHPEGSYRREGQFWLGEITFQGGDIQSALTQFAKLIAEPAKPSDPPGLVRTAKRREVQALVQLEKWADGLKAGDAYIASQPKGENDPFLPEVDYSRGRALQGLARFDEAREAFTRVIAARKGSELAAKAQFMRGETYFHQKDYRKALPEFLKVDYLYESPVWQANALLEAGKVHEQLGQWAEAAETYERLRSKFPSDPNAAKAEERLAAARKRAEGVKSTGEGQ